VIPIDDAKFTMRPNEALRGHVRAHRLHRPQRALDPRAVEHVEVVLADLGDRGERPEGLGVVDQPVDPPEAVHGRRHHRADLVVLHHVAPHPEHGRAQALELRDRRVEQIGLPFRHDDRGAALRQVDGHPLADTTPGTGDDDDLPRHRVHRRRVPVHGRTLPSGP
jgi:hypothetical protein